MPITLADIARVAGLSKSGVSLALRNHASIPRATQERVAALAKEMNYRPNPLVVANMTHVRDVHRADYRATLAFVWRGDGVARTFEFKPQLDGARRRAAELGFALDAIDMSNQRLNTKRLDQILHSRAICGIILAGALDEADDFNLAWEKLCAVVIGDAFAAINAHRVAFDTYSAAASALERVQRLGYRRPGFVMLQASLDRYAGAPLASFDYFRRRQRTFALIPPLLARSTTFSEFQNWYERHRPDVILSNHWNEIEAQCQAMGLRIPTDIGYTGIANLPRAASVSGIRQRYEALGAAATDILAQRLTHGEFGLPDNPTTTLLKGSWQDGSTLRTGEAAAGSGK